MRAEDQGFEALKKEDQYWRTRDGKVLEISKMDPWHCYHAIQLIQRHEEDTNEYFKIISEPEIRFEIPDALFERVKILHESYPEYFI